MLVKMALLTLYWINIIKWWSGDNGKVILFGRDGRWELLVSNLGSIGGMSNWCAVLPPFRLCVQTEWLMSLFGSICGG